MTSMKTCGNLSCAYHHERPGKYRGMEHIMTILCFFFLMFFFLFISHLLPTKATMYIYLKLVLMRGQTHPLVAFTRASSACGSANQLLMTSAVTGSLFLGSYVKMARAYYKLY